MQADVCDYPSVSGHTQGGGSSCYAWLCVSKSYEYLFQAQVREMTENVSLEMGVECPASLYVGGNSCCRLSIIMNTRGENEVQ